MRTRSSVSLIAALAIAGCDGCDVSSVSELVPALTADPLTLDFGEVYAGARPTLALALRSTGNTPARVLDLELAAPFFVDEGGPGPIAVGETETLVIAFAPEEAGVASGALRIDTNAEDALQIALAGFALPPLECDDDNDCTDDAFDPDLGACLHAPRDGEICDDGSACTAGDRCDGSACRGEGIACDDGIPCTRDVCDPAAGCDVIPDDDACADDVPCSLDLCVPGVGCQNPPAPDNTICGEIVPCETLPICLSQVCTPLPIPDGAPCSDGDVCSLEDRCEAGVCVGTDSELPPTVIEERRAALLDGRLHRRGDLLFAARSTLVAVDLSGPIVGPVTLTPPSPRDVHNVGRMLPVDDRYVVANTPGRLVLLDFNDPLSPVAVDELPVSEPNLRPKHTVIADGVFHCDQGLFFTPLLPGPAFGERVAIFGGCPALEDADGDRVYTLEARPDGAALVAERLTPTGAVALGEAEFANLAPLDELALFVGGGFVALAGRPGVQPPMLFHLFDVRAGPPVSRPPSPLVATFYGLTQTSLLGKLGGDIARFSLADLDAPPLRFPVDDAPFRLPTFVDDDLLLFSEATDATLFRLGADAAASLEVHGHAVGATANALLRDGDDWLFANQNHLVRFAARPPFNGAEALRSGGVPALLEVGGELGASFLVVLDDGVASLERATLPPGDDALLFAEPLTYEPGFGGQAVLGGSGRGCIFAAVLLETPFASTTLQLLDRCAGVVQSPPRLLILDQELISNVSVRDQNDGHISVTTFGDLSPGDFAILYEISAPGTLESRAGIRGFDAAYDAGLWVVLDNSPLRLKVLRAADAFDSADVLEFAVDDFDAPYDYEVLGVRAPLAVVASRTQVHLYDVSGAPQLMATLPLVNASTLRTDGERLVIGHAGGVAIVSPPCGPPVTSP
jgi:hypothetical protein